MDLLFGQGEGVGFNEVFQALTGQAGVIALSIFIIYAGYKKWWNWGHVTTALELDLKEERKNHKESIQTLKVEFNKREEQLVKERNEWQKLALNGLRAAEKALLHAEIERGGHVEPARTEEG